MQNIASVEKLFWVTILSVARGAVNQNAEWEKYHVFSTFESVFCRDRVEDQTFEAKDSKKIRGQGQGLSFRVLLLPRQRKRMLEAKAKDRGHNFLNYGRQIFIIF